MDKRAHTGMHMDKRAPGSSTASVPPRGGTSVRSAPATRPMNAAPPAFGNAYAHVHRNERALAHSGMHMAAAARAPAAASVTVEAGAVIDSVLAVVRPQ